MNNLTNNTINIINLYPLDNMYEVLFSVKVTAALTIDIIEIPINKRYFKTFIFFFSFPFFFIYLRKFI